MNINETPAETAALLSKITALCWVLFRQSESTSLDPSAQLRSANMSSSINAAAAFSVSITSACEFFPANVAVNLMQAAKVAEIDSAIKKQLMAKIRSTSSSSSRGGSNAIRSCSELLAFFTRVLEGGRSQEDISPSHASLARAAKQAFCAQTLEYIITTLSNSVDSLVRICNFDTFYRALQHHNHNHHHQHHQRVGDTNDEEEVRGVAEEETALGDSAFFSASSLSMLLEHEVDRVSTSTVPAKVIVDEITSNIGGGGPLVRVSRARLQEAVAENFSPALSLAEFEELIAQLFAPAPLVVQCLFADSSNNNNISSAALGPISAALASFCSVRKQRLRNQILHCFDEFLFHPDGRKHGMLLQQQQSENNNNNNNSNVVSPPSLAPLLQGFLAPSPSSSAEASFDDASGLLPPARSPQPSVLAPAAAAAALQLAWSVRLLVNTLQVPTTEEEHRVQLRNLTASRLLTRANQTSAMAWLAAHINDIVHDETHGLRAGCSLASSSSSDVHREQQSGAESPSSPSASLPASSLSQTVGLVTLLTTCRALASYRLDSTAIIVSQTSADDNDSNSSSSAAKKNGSNTTTAALLGALSRACFLQCERITLLRQQQQQQQSCWPPRISRAAAAAVMSQAMMFQAPTTASETKKNITSILDSSFSSSLLSSSSLLTKSQPQLLLPVAAKQRQLPPVAQDAEESNGGARRLHISPSRRVVDRAPRAATSPEERVERGNNDDNSVEVRRQVEKNLAAAGVAPAISFASSSPDPAHHHHRALPRKLTRVHDVRKEQLRNRQLSRMLEVQQREQEEMDAASFSSGRYYGSARGSPSASPGRSCNGQFDANARLFCLLTLCGCKNAIIAYDLVQEGAAAAATRGAKSETSLSTQKQQQQQQHKKHQTTELDIVFSALNKKGLSVLNSAAKSVACGAGRDNADFNSVRSRVFLEPGTVLALRVHAREASSSASRSVHIGRKQWALPSESELLAHPLVKATGSYQKILRLDVNATYDNSSNAEKQAAFDKRVQETGLFVGIDMPLFREAIPFPIARASQCFVMVTLEEITLFVSHQSRDIYDINEISGRSDVSGAYSVASSNSMFSSFGADISHLPNEDDVAALGDSALLLHQLLAAGFGDVEVVVYTSPCDSDNMATPLVRIGATSVSAQRKSIRFDAAAATFALPLSEVLVMSKQQRQQPEEGQEEIEEEEEEQRPVVESWGCLIVEVIDAASGEIAGSFRIAAQELAKYGSGSAIAEFAADELTGQRRPVASDVPFGSRLTVMGIPMLPLETEAAPPKPPTIVARNKSESDLSVVVSGSPTKQQEINEEEEL